MQETPDTTKTPTTTKREGNFLNKRKAATQASAKIILAQFSIKGRPVRKNMQLLNSSYNMNSETIKE